MCKDIQDLKKGTYKKGDFLMTENNHCDKAFYIQSGVVEVFKTDDKGQRISLAKIGKNSIVGEMALLGDRTRRSASIEALTDIIVVPITKHNFHRLLSHTDKAVKALLEILAERLERTNSTVCTQFHDISFLEETVRKTINTMVKQLPEQHHKTVENGMVSMFDDLSYIKSKYNASLTDDIKEVKKTG